MLKVLLLHRSDIWMSPLARMRGAGISVLNTLLQHRHDFRARPLSRLRGGGISMLYKPVDSETCVVDAVVDADTPVGRAYEGEGQGSTLDAV